MRKFTKVMLIAALITGLLGAVLTGAGIIAGGSARVFVHNSGPGVFRVLSGLFHGTHWESDWEEDLEQWEDDWEEGLEQWEDDWEEGWEQWEDNLEDSLQDSYHHGANSVSRQPDRIEDVTEEPQSHTLKAENIRKLSLEISEGAGEMKAVQGEEIKISGLYPSDIMSYDEENGELYLERGNDNQVSKEPLVIEIPKDKKFLQIELRAKGGELKTSEKLSSEAASIESEAGKLEIGLLDSEKSELQCSGGKMLVTYQGKLNDYSLKLDSENTKLSLDNKEYAGYQKGIFGNPDSQRTVKAKSYDGIMEIKFEN